MANRTYDQARADFEYLETLAETQDIVEVSARLFDLMRSPTKAMATELYHMAIDAWLSEAALTNRELTTRALEIKARWGFTSTANGGDHGA